MHLQFTFFFVCIENIPKKNNKNFLGPFLLLSIPFQEITSDSLELKAKAGFGWINQK